MQSITLQTITSNLLLDIPPLKRENHVKAEYLRKTSENMKLLSINIRNVIIVVFILLFIIGIGYKYYEWSTLQNLSALYNKTWTQEFGLVQDENKNVQPYLDVQKKIYDKSATNDTFISLYDEYTGKLRLIIANQENYRDTIKQNSNAYSNINTSFLFGKRGDFAKNLVSSQEQYYTYELNDADLNDASDWLNYNIITVLKDNAVVLNFRKNIGSTNLQTTIPKYYPDLYPIEKYTHSDFKFEHEDDIKKYYPNGYDALTRYKNFFSDFYSLNQDAVNGDYNSVAYKLPTLQTTQTNLNVSFSDLFNQNNDTRNENAKNIIQLVSNEANSIKDFKAEKLYSYPLLPPIGSWKEDLVLCQMYDFKSGLYHNISTSYIKSKDANSLLNELSTVSPDTKFVDIKFDKGVLMLVNDDKKIQFTCLDKRSNTAYQFIMQK